MRLHPARELPEGRGLRPVRVVRKPHGVKVSLCHAVEKRALEPSAETVGIDMGVRSRMTLSDGTVLAAAQLDWQPIRPRQRAISRCKRGSKMRRKRVGRLAALGDRAKVRNRNACHRATTSVVRRFGVIAVEDLRIRNMSAWARGTAEEPGGAGGRSRA